MPQQTDNNSGAVGGFETAVGRFDATLKSTMKDLNSKEALAPRHHNEGLPHFVGLSRQLGEALVEIAQQQLNAAQNNLADMQRWAENMQAEAQEKWAEMQAMERKFEDYRSYILQANDRFDSAPKRNQ